MHTRLLMQFNVFRFFIGGVLVDLVFIGKGFKLPKYEAVIHLGVEGDFLLLWLSLLGFCW